jgi:hypothetical protein
VKDGKYKTEFARQAMVACSKRGAFTDHDLAELFNVSTGTIGEWKKKHPKFKEAIDKAKKQADTIVERSLFERAIGYSHPDCQIFLYKGEAIFAPYTKHYPPDPQSAIFWLKNRRPGEWRDRQEHDVNFGMRKLTDEELNARIDALINARKKLPLPLEEDE